jgi:hypothetical protein
VGGLSDAEEITGYDEVDEQSVFDHGNAGSGGGGSKASFEAGNSRRRGKKGLSPGYRSTGGKPGRAIGGRSFRRSPGFGGFAANFDPRRIAASVSSLLGIAVIGVVVAAIILYLTFVSGTLAIYLGPQANFYGALVASMVIVLVLAYIVAKLLAREE